MSTDAVSRVVNATREEATIPVEVVSWITRFVGGDGSGRRVIQVRAPDHPTVRTVLRALTAQYPDLHAALWQDGELGEHIEVLVNDAVLGVDHVLDSPLRPGDQLSLLAQFMGGSDTGPDEKTLVRSPA